MTDQAFINLPIPKELKARWVRASRAAGMKLSDWIIQRVESTLHMANIRVPSDLPFSALNLARDPDGAVSMDVDTLVRICELNGFPPQLLENEDNLAQLVNAWYQAHLAAGGAPDQVQEELIAEALAEDAAGQQYSYQPGRA